MIQHRLALLPSLLRLQLKMVLASTTTTTSTNATNTPTKNKTKSHTTNISTSIKKSRTQDLVIHNCKYLSSFFLTNMRLYT